MNLKTSPKYPITLGMLALYGVMLVGVLQFSPQVLTNNPWFSDVTDALAKLLPMIDRVPRYGHPHPEKLRALLALGWLASLVTIFPALAISVYQHPPWPEGPTVGKASAGLIVSSCLFWFVAYWPFMADNQVAIRIVSDSRRGMFISDFSAFICTPIVLTPAWVMLFFIYLAIASFFCKSSLTQGDSK